LYESIAAIFIAQMQPGPGMPFYQYLIIRLNYLIIIKTLIFTIFSLITILSSIGAAAVPSGGLIAMVGSTNLIF